MVEQTAQIIRNRRHPYYNRWHFYLILIFTVVTTSILLLAYLYHSSGDGDSDSEWDLETQSLKLLESPYDKINATDEQKILIQKFREEFKDNFTQDFMSTNYGISQWLLQANWDLDLAMELFTQHLEWREEYKIDGILDEDFGNFSSEYPIFNDGVDKFHRPVFTADFSSWDVRRITVSGKRRMFIRYIFSRYEISSKLIREAHAKYGNVSQQIIIFNFKGFNMVQHGCFHCMKYYLQFANSVEDNYPWNPLYKLFLINTPDEFDFFISLLPEKFERNMENYGSNKAIWQPKILELIDPHEIRPQFGGSKVDHTSEIES